MTDQIPLLEDYERPPRVSSLFTYACRVFYVTLVIGVCFYSFNLNAVEGRDKAGFGAETVFLWHPYFMVLGYVVCMTEALFAFSSHPTHEANESNRKRWHVFLHILTGILVLVGLAAVLAHKLLGKESIIPSSGHSYLGTMCILLHISQVALGSTNVLGPRGAPGSPHRFLGLCLYFLAMATIVAGLVQHSTEFKAFKFCARTMMPGFVALALFVGIHFRKVVMPEPDNHV